MKQNQPYQSDVNDHEWNLIRRLFPERGKLGRPPRYPVRLVLNAIFYIARTGCTWRDLPHDFPHWRLVYYYFAKWQALGVWERLNTRLRDKVRLASAKKKPLRPRASTLKVSKFLASAASAATMQARRSWAESGTFWSTLWD